MKVQSTVFALFLVAFALLSTRSSAQSYIIQPTSELESSQEANRLGEEILKNESYISEAQKSEKRSMDAMHWNAIVVNQDNQQASSDMEKSVSTKKLPVSRVSVYKPVTESVKTTEKPVYN